MVRVGPRRLFFDLEVSPCLALVWRAGGRVFVSHEALLEPGKVICACWKWEGERVVHSRDWGPRQNDAPILRELVRNMNAAAEVVAHNGDRFDIPWVRTRCLFHGIDCPPDFTSTDTLRAARGRFYFPSNRLDYLGRYLKLGSKTPTTFDLWKRLFTENRESDRVKMVRYCKNDVRVLERIYDQLAPYLRPKINRAEYLSQCPECGSDDTWVNRRKKTAAGYLQVQFRCKDCGQYHTIAASRFDKDRRERDRAA